MNSSFSVMDNMTDRNNTQAARKRENAWIAVTIGLICFLTVAVFGVHYFNELNDWRLLNTQGETFAVPLVDLDWVTCSNSTCYDVAFLYQGRIHKQRISGQTRKIIPITQNEQNQDMVDIIAAGDVVYVAGFEPDFAMLAFCLSYMACVGMLFLLIGGVVLWRVPRRQSRQIPL